MNASLVLIVVMAVMYACGVFLILERSLTRVLLGFLLVGNATNLLLLIASGPAGLAPVIEGDPAAAEGLADPLPQALILTAIVITFAVSAFLLALIYRSWRIARADIVIDDIDDVAMRAGTAALPAVATDSDDSGDTEFEADGEIGTDAPANPSGGERL